MKKSEHTYQQKSLARAAFYKTIFAHSFQSSSTEFDHFEQYKVVFALGQEGVDQDFLAQLLASYRQNQEEVFILVDRYLHPTRASKCSKLEKAVIIGGGIELVYFPQTPQKDIINEAIEFVKKYGSEGGHKLVNAVLDRIARFEKEKRLG